FGEALADQRARPLGGVPLAPGRLAQPVTEFDLAGSGVRTRPEMEPAQELPGCLLDGRPESIALVPLVIVQEGGQELILDFLAGGGYAARGVAHDVGIGVGVHQVVDMSQGHPAQQQAVRLEENLHRPILPIPPRYGARLLPFDYRYYRFALLSTHHMDRTA